MTYGYQDGDSEYEMGQAIRNAIEKADAVLPLLLQAICHTAFPLSVLMAMILPDLHSIGNGTFFVRRRLELHPLFS